MNLVFVNRQIFFEKRQIKDTAKTIVKFRGEWIIKKGKLKIAEPTTNYQDVIVKYSIEKINDTLLIIKDLFQSPKIGSVTKYRYFLFKDKSNENENYLFEKKMYCVWSRLNIEHDTLFNLDSILLYKNIVFDGEADSSIVSLVLNYDNFAICKGEKKYLSRSYGVLKGGTWNFNIKDKTISLTTTEGEKLIYKVQEVGDNILRLTTTNKSYTQ